ncbi:Transcriptional regulator, GntR family (plasmid) [Deinococcus gobiensis I-0]|uniref:Transcriptional regulator, GntR family n=1 Tax=Deinococcus gobiensis (strain DSM 21396 / JCM 16679 / CGMCC 1.7299 / I-0) TaxID=745776 RepID=H8H0S9_DEIGI|nr:Transcriptional regulator, GntR family [Deinococcus gobiensis I-0]
MELTGDPE